MTATSRPASLASGAVAVSCALAVAGLALIATAPSPAGSVRSLRGLIGPPPDPSLVAAPLDPAAPVLAVLGLVAWALTAYLALGVGLVLLGHLPGLLGRVAVAVAARTVPVPVRRTVEAVLGAGLVLSSVVASPAAATPHTAPITTTTANLDWPVTATAPATAPATTPAGAPAGAVAAVSPPGATHVVRPGDTLWDLAAQALRAPSGAAPSDVAVAAAWPSWWEANRDAIGDDPHLLRPGTPLIAPPSAS